MHVQGKWFDEVEVGERFCGRMTITETHTSSKRPSDLHDELWPLEDQSRVDLDHAKANDRTTAVDLSLSGRPDRPPSSVACASPATAA